MKWLKKYLRRLDSGVSKSWRPNVLSSVIFSPAASISCLKKCLAVTINCNGARYSVKSIPELIAEVISVGKLKVPIV